MTEWLWRRLAWLVTRESVYQWLCARAMRTPYTHITSASGTDRYMGRWWLFNPYAIDTPPRWPWLPSIRVHHILRADNDRHLHNHPWNARTIIMRGFYGEQRPLLKAADALRISDPKATGPLLHSQFHRIAYVPEDGAWTLFFTWRKQGTWGFDVDGRFVPWREYLNG